MVEEYGLAEPEHTKHRQNGNHQKHQAIGNCGLGKNDRVQDRRDSNEHGGNLRAKDLQSGSAAQDETPSYGRSRLEGFALPRCSLWNTQFRTDRLSCSQRAKTSVLPASHTRRDRFSISGPESLIAPRHAVSERQ